MEHVIPKGSLEVGDHLQLRSGTGAVEMLIYEVVRPSGTIVGRWVVPAHATFVGGWAIDGEVIEIGLEGFVHPPWILRGRRSTEDFWVTIAERPDSIPQTADTDQAGHPGPSPV